MSAQDSAARQRPASYLVHTPFSPARFHYRPEAGAVSNDHRGFRGSRSYFQARIQLSPLDALAALTAFIPEKSQQMVRYYGYYSNKARRQRRRRQDEVAALAAESSSPDTTDSDPDFLDWVATARQFDGID